jgi:DNA-binding MarR family transcriptional regulator
MPDEAQTPADQAARIARVAAALVRAMRAHATRDTSLSLTQEWALALLVDSEGMSSADLARAQNVRAQTMSTAVAGLEVLGYVSKLSDRDDARRITLRATASGVEALEASRGAKREWLQSTVAAFDAEDARALTKGLDLLERIVDAV